MVRCCFLRKTCIAQPRFKKNIAFFTQKKYFLKKNIEIYFYMLIKQARISISANRFTVIVPRILFIGLKKGRPIMSHTFQKSFFLLLVSCFVFAFFQNQAQAEEQQQDKSIAIVPFQVHASKDLSYLKNGIRDMLASRLATGGGVKIISKSAMDQVLTGAEMITLAQFAQIGKTLGADYLVSGSFTSLGGGASLDAKVFDTKSKESLDFYATAPKEDDVIMAINTLAWDIGEKVLGRQRPAAAMPQVQALAPVPQAMNTSYQTAHPDRAFFGAGGAYGSPFIRPLGVTGAFGFSKSQNFPMAMQAMDVGDVDGDGTDDVVIASRTKVTVYRRTEGRFAKIAEAPVGARYKIHYISLADLNNNGKVEIYVSTNEKNRPNSFCMEWQGEKLDYLFQDARFYIRAMQVPGDGMVLAGQKGSMDSESFEPGIYQLEQKDGRVQAGTQIMVPGSVNMFDFAFVDLEADGRMELVAINQSDKIKVLSQNGKQMWKSSDYYGGTKRFVGELEMEYSAANVKRYYIPSRIIIADLNGDDKADVIVNKNLSSASRAFTNLKSYPDGEIHGLAWNGIGLTELWRTRKIDGYIADYQLKMIDDEPGKAILYVGVILSTGVDEIFSASESTVLMYPLDFGEDDK